VLGAPCRERGARVAIVAVTVRVIRGGSLDRVLRINSRARRSTSGGVVKVWPFDARDPDAIFREILDGVPAPFALLAPSGAIVRANSALQGLVGRPKGTAVSFQDLGATKADRLQLTRAVRRASSHSASTTVEASVVMAVGAPRKLSWTLSAVDVGSPHVLACGQDVSGVRKLQSAMTAIEEVGRVLGLLGPAPEALERVIGRLVERLGYPFVAIYLLEGNRLRLGAQSGYGDPLYEIESGKGVMARAIRTGKTQFVPDVREDPDFIGTNMPVRGEITAPLVADGKPFGVLNVETAETDPLLDESDVSLLQSVAERLASAIVLGRDRVELAQRAEALRASEQHTRSIIELARDVYVEIDGDGHIIEWNPEATALFGFEKPDVIGKELFEAVAAGRPLPSFDGIGTASAEPGGQQIEFQAVTRTGEAFPAEMTTWPIQAADGATHIVALIRDITSRKVLERQLRENALRDALTGLANRTLFVERVQLAMSARKADGTAVGVLFIDLDEFKQVNDTYGHPAGDELLIGVAERLSQAVRPGDTVARLGGDEFAVLLEQPTTLAQAMSLGERLAGQLRRPFSIAGTELIVGASIGAAMSDQLGSEGTELLERADAAMYVAKSERSGGVRMFEEWMQRVVSAGIEPQRSP
jgi:diguanylate cyclase (GGDEF)-like protein/PAS domain S-box-containing protein